MICLYIIINCFLAEPVAKDPFANQPISSKVVESFYELSPMKKRMVSPHPCEVEDLPKWGKSKKDATPTASTKVDSEAKKEEEDGMAPNGDNSSRGKLATYLST